MERAYTRPVSIVVFLVVSIMACKRENRIEQEIAALKVETRLSRFEQLFASAGAEGLPELKKDFPYLFPEQYPDSLWLLKMQDSLFLELKGQVDSVYGHFDHQTRDLKSLNQHWAYYFPGIPVPHTVTLINERDYENRIILADSLLFIGLDNYLGPEHHFYRDLPRYVAQQLQPAYLLPDIAATYSKRVNLKSVQARTFLDRMVHFGKELYIKEMLLPEAKAEDLIGFSPEHWEWAEANEAEIWSYFIENDLLFSTDSKLDRQFLDPAPFSKFGLELDSESPGRIGRYMGWQIVRSYAEKTEVSLSELIQTPADRLFEKANYKPKK